MVKCNLILCCGNLFSPSSPPLLFHAYKIYKNACQTPNFTCNADICQVHRKSVGGRHLTRLSIFVQSPSKIINQFPLAASSSMFAALNELWSVWISEVCPFRKLDECLPSVYGEEFGVGLQAKHQILDSRRQIAYMSHSR